MRETESCENCRFSRPHHDGQHVRCCFNPPTVVPSVFTNGVTDGIDSGVDTGWPIVAKDDWCGKFDKRIRV